MLVVKMVLFLEFVVEDEKEDEKVDEKREFEMLMFEISKIAKRKMFVAK